MGVKEGVMTVKVIATDMDGTFLTDKKTYDKYIIKLVGADLVSITTPLTLHTENILLENDFSKQKKLSTKKVNKIAEIDDNGNIIIPK